jgi:radical SAM superfamily enzyme YgiQ (UPF0313 family)
MKVLLINPFIDFDIVKNIFAIESELPPLGLLYLGGILENEGHEAKLIDFCAENYTEKKLVNSLSGIDAVGITVRSHDVRCVNKIIDVIRRTNSQIPIIVGGPHCTLDPINAMNNLNADILVEGDGEIALQRTINNLENNNSLDEIHGVYYKEKNILKHGPPAQIITDLDSLPFPARHLVDNYKYGYLPGGVNLTRGKVTSMMISRGCPYNCKFCINRAITKKYRTRSTENVTEELQQIIHKYDFLHIIDDNFFVDRKKADEILDFLIREKSDLELWISGIRTDVADNKLFKKMKKAGVTTINIGIESGNQEVLEFYNKQITINQIKKAISMARKTGFLTIGYFILGAPIETEQHLKNTINFAKTLPLDQAIFSPLGYLKGSPLWHDAVSEGKIKEHEYIVASDRDRGLGNFTSKELWDWCIWAYKDFYLRPSYIFDQLIQAFIRRDFRIIKEGYKLLLREDNVLKYNIIND